VDLAAGGGIGATFRQIEECVTAYLFYASELYSFSILRPIQAAIFDRGDDAAWFFEKPQKLASFLRNDEKWLKTVNEVKTFNPCAVFSAQNIIPDFFPGVKVQVFHGFPAFKRTNKKPEKDGDFRVRGFFDLYCTQGPLRTSVYMNLSAKYGFFEVVETGWPKMDPLFKNYPEPLNNNDRPVVLFTSTFTRRLSAAPILFETISRLSENGKWNWLINFHPKMDKAIVAKYRSIQNQNLKFVETDDIIPLLKTADIMVSDTSSVISEFLLLYKPVVTINNQKPGPHLINITNADALDQQIEYGLMHPPALMDEIRKYADQIHPYRDGRSSQRVLLATDRLVQKGTEHLRRKPLNLIRRLKLRHLLGYYRIR